MRLSGSGVGTKYDNTWRQDQDAYFSQPVSMTPCGMSSTFTDQISEPASPFCIQNTLPLLSTTITPFGFGLGDIVDDPSRC